MTPWDDAIARVEVRLPFPVRFSARMTDHDMVEIRCVLSVPDMHTKRPTTVTMAEHVSGVLVSVAGQVAHLRHLLWRALEHEMDESIFLDGKQVRDPHIAPNQACPRHEKCRITRVLFVDGVQRFGCTTTQEPE